MKNPAQELDVALKAVCPIVGVSIGRSNDRATWRIDFEDRATAEQRAAARAVMDAFDPEAPEPEAPKEETVADLKAALIAKGVLTVEDMKAARR